MKIDRKKVLVVGLKRSGIAAVKFLKSKGADITVTDKADISKLLEEIKEIGSVKIELGKHNIKTFKESDIIIVSPGVPHTIEPIIEAEKSGAEVIGEMEFASRFIKEPIIAITGTNGKTTACGLTAEMLKYSGKKVFKCGNIGTPLIEYINGGLKADVLVVEVSSFQLDTIKTFRPHISVILNITEDHLDRYPDFDGYVKSKARIFENQTAGDFVIFNGADSASKAIIEKAKGAKLFFNRPNKMPGIDIKEGRGLFFPEDGPDLGFLQGSEIFDFSKAKIKGDHNIENVAAAAMAALIAGGTADGIQAGLINYNGLEHRIEFVREIDGVKYYNDSKGTNIDAVFRAIDTFNSPVILIMGGRDKGADFSRLIDRVKQKVTVLIALGEAKDKILTVFKGIVKTIDADSMEDAVKKACTISKKGDTVLLSPGCTSFDMFKDYEHRGKVFKKEVMKHA